MPKDLREYLSALRKRLSKEYVEVNAEIDPRFEATAVLQKLEDMGKFPAVLFSNVKNLHGQAGNKLLMNVTSSRSKVALACGLDPSQNRMELTSRVAELSRAYIEPVLVDKSDAPVKEQVFDDPDLRVFPIVTHHELDGGPYLTMPCITKHSEWSHQCAGVYNVAFNRVQYRDPRTGRILIGITHNNVAYRAYEDKGLPCPIAIVLGHHPLFLLGACLRPPLNVSEYGVIGALLGEPLRLVASETWGEDFLVPADAEIVIEAETLPGLLEEEGPFGEWTGYTSGRTMSPVITVKAITSRRDPILMSNFVGHRDHDGLSGTSWAASMYERARQAASGVIGVNLPHSGRAGFHAYIQMKKYAEGDQILAALAAATIGHVKLIVVVDEDIDVFDEEEVLMAVATRVQADRQVQVIRNARGSPLDPSNVGKPNHATMIIDATKPLGTPFPTRVKVPKHVLDSIDLKSLITNDILQSPK